MASTFDLPDFVLLGGIATPGVATVSDGDDGRGWDEQAAAGTTGASLKWKGDGLQEFSVSVLLWTEEQFADWRRFDDTVLARTKPGVKPKAYVVEHPQINESKVEKVVVTGRRPRQPLEDGSWEASFKLKEYRPPKPAITGKPTATADGDPSKASPTAKDEADKMIEDLEGQIAKEKKALAEAEANYK